MSDSNAWLTGLKVGDEVAVYFSHSVYGRYEFLTVTGTTAKFFKVGGYNYRKQDGGRAGDRYAAYLRELTPALRAQEAEKKRRQMLTRVIDAIRWTSIPTETLEAVYALVEKENK